MPVNHTQLGIELNTDVRGYGYAPHISSGNDNMLADIINTVRDGTNPPLFPLLDGGAANGAITIRRNAIAVKDVIEAIDLADYPALPANPNNSQLSTERRFLSFLQLLSSLITVRILNDDGTNNPVATNLLSIFPAGSPTRNRLIALATRFGSRAEEKWGQGTTVTATDVSIALRGAS